MPLPETIALKILYPFLGSVIALLVIPPKTRSEVVRRGTVSVIAGYVSGPTLHEWMGIADTAHNAGFSLALAAFLSWWVLGALPRMAGRVVEKTER